MTAPSIVSTVPTSGAEGVPINATISVIFDREVDTYRLTHGGIFLEGPDQSKSIGPGFLHLNPPQTDEDEMLASPSYKGIEECDVSILRVDGTGESVNYYDYGTEAAAGALYRTKVVLTPKRPLGALTEYTVYVVGDSDTTDSYDFGLTGRTVFDAQKGANLGNGEAIFYGGYTGLTDLQVFVEIITAGDSGTAEYEWWSSADPVHKSLRTSLNFRLLQDGIRIKFAPGLNYQIGDTFSVWALPPEYMSGAYKFSFTTSSQSPETLPVPSTMLSGGITTSSTSFEVLSTTPLDRATFVATTTTSIAVTFSDDINSSTVTDSTVTVESFAADESFDSSVPYTGILTKALTVSGAVLTITLTADQLYSNNIVVVTLASSIGSTTTTLGEDYQFFFGTTLDPFYAGIRGVRFRLGTAGSYFPDETIALAIWDASRLVLANAPTTISNMTAYVEARRQFVTCYAAYMLVTGGGGSSASARMRLGDFDVSKTEGGASGLDDILKTCWEKWLPIVAPGATTFPLEKPLNVVKGDDTYDDPPHGRLWDYPSVPIVNARVVYSGERRWYKTHLGRGPRR